MNTHSSRRRTGRTLAAGIVLAAGVLVAAPAQAARPAAAATTSGAAIPDGAVMTYQRCMFGAPRTADSHEAWALRCQARVEAGRS